MRGICRLRFPGDAPGRHRRRAVVLAHLLPQGPQRDDLCSFLQEHGIATGVHYTPIHLYSCYGNRPRLPQAEEVFPRIVSLPIYPDMTDADIQQVIDSVIAYYVATGYIGSGKATARPPRKEAPREARR